MSARRDALNALEDRLHDLRQIYDTNLESIASATLETAGIRERPVLEPAPGEPDRVMVIYGFRQPRTGPARTLPDPPNTESIAFRRNNTRTLDIWSIDQLDPVDPQPLYARTPLLFRRGDSLTVDFQPRHVDRPAMAFSGVGIQQTYQPVSRDDLGNTDHIMLLGKVVEALGTVVRGDTPVLRAISRAVRRKKVEPSPEQVAHQLFMSYLSKEEKDMWQKFGVVIVPSKIRPAFSYEITERAVYLINEKKQRVEHYCVIAAEQDGYVPQYDVTLSKYLLLQANEEKFLRIANRSRASGLSQLVRPSLPPNPWHGTAQTAAERLRVRLR